METNITIKSNKTLTGYDKDGKSLDITIQASKPRKDNGCFGSTPFRMLRADHVIVHGLTLDGKEEKWYEDGECSDGFFVEESYDVWIHRNKFSRFGDVALQLKDHNGQKKLCERWTVTENIFEEMWQGFALSVKKFSFGRNFCNKVKNRCVKLNKGQ